MIDESVPEGVSPNNGAPDLPMGGATTADVVTDAVLPAVETDEQTASHIIPTTTVANSVIDSGAKMAGIKDSGPHIDPMTITGEGVNIEEAEKDWVIKPIEKAKKIQSKRRWRDAIAWLAGKEVAQDERLRTPKNYDHDKRHDFDAISERVEEKVGNTVNNVNKVLPFPFKPVETDEEELKHAA